MRLQRAAATAVALAVSLIAGCAPSKPRPDASYSLVASGETHSNVRAYQSAHYTLYSTLSDVERVGPIIDTLEVAYQAYTAATGLPATSPEPRMSVYVFQRRAEWETFTKLRTGRAASTFLKLHKGGYTFAEGCAVFDQGDRDTRTILAHEGFHLFVNTRFIARPPPFIEEGLATTFESILDAEGRADASRIDSATPGDPRRAAIAGHRHPLRQWLGTHAGTVIDQSPGDIMAFYAEGQRFVRYCLAGENGRYRAGFERMLSDAAAGRLATNEMAGNASLVERYLGERLEAIDARLDGLASSGSGD